MIITTSASAIDQGDYGVHALDSPVVEVQFIFAVLIVALLVGG